MKFSIQSACPTATMWANEIGERVLIKNTAGQEKVYASGSLMQAQIDTVIAAQHKKLDVVFTH